MSKSPHETKPSEKKSGFGFGLTGIGSKSNLSSLAKNIFSSKKFSIRSKGANSGTRQVSPLPQNEDEDVKEADDKPQLKTNKFTSNLAPKTSQSSMAFYPGSQSPKLGLSSSKVPVIRND